LRYHERILALREAIGFALPDRERQAYARKQSSVEPPMAGSVLDAMQTLENDDRK
jgi:hypothetical protein